MNTPKKSQVQRTVDRREQMSRLLKIGTLIPLHMHDDVRTRKGGKVQKMGKAPVHPHWMTRQYSSHKVMDAALESGRNVGWRIPSTVVVVDIDVRAGGDTGFEMLCNDVGINPDKYPTAITGAKGRHIFTTIPEGVKVRDTLEADEYRGLEFKSWGRQIVAAGSLHPDTGKYYHWDKTKPDIRQGVPKIPTPLLNLIKRPPPSAITGGGQYDQEQINALLAKLDPEDFADQAKWLSIMQACHHASHGDARQEFIEWSTGDAQYADDADIIGRRWDSMGIDKTENVVSYKTLNMYVRDAGHASSIPTASAAELSEDFPDDIADMSFEADDDAWLEGLEPDSGGDDPQDPTAVMSRGLKVSKGSSVAADTFKNAFYAVMNSGLAIGFNDMAKTVEFIGDVPWNEKEFGRVLDDKVLAMFRLFIIGKFQGNDFDPSEKHLLAAVNTYAYSRRFNPVADYLKEAESNWDGVPRVDKLFGEYFNCGVDSYTCGVSSAFMVGAARRARRPGSKFDTMPVLKSPQGWNKSTAFRVLFGDQYYSDSNLGPLNSKDAALKLRGLWLCEFAEIESLRKHEVNILKAFVSQLSDRQRDPYDRLTSDVKRTNVFAATVNEGGYLGDMTGGRRFWPLEATARIDIAKLKADRDQLWGEAAALETGGAPDVLPQSLWAVAASRQEAETMPDPWEDTIRAYLQGRGEATDDMDGSPLPADKVHTSELFSALGIAEKDQSKAYMSRIRGVMEARLGGKHKKSMRINGEVRAGYELRV
jgi:predicted P-loop ATPase